MSAKSKDPKDPVVEITTRMPYRVKNVETLTDSENRPLETRAIMHLCRCGATRKSPYCDGSHLRHDFIVEKNPNRKPDRFVSYKGKEITIYDNRGICSRDGSCTRELPEVFRKNALRWINPDAAPVDKIIATIRNCPSGALCYALNNEEKIDNFNLKTCIHTAKNGPLEFKGGIQMIDCDNNQPATDDHYTLCRCGRSNNPPFCDGSHESEINPANKE